MIRKVLNKTKEEKVRLRSVKGMCHGS